MNFTEPIISMDLASRCNKLSKDYSIPLKNVFSDLILRYNVCLLEHPEYVGRESHATFYAFSDLSKYYGRTKFV